MRDKSAAEKHEKTAASVRQPLPCSRAKGVMGCAGSARKFFWIDVFAFCGGEHAKTNTPRPARREKLLES